MTTLHPAPLSEPTWDTLDAIVAAHKLDTLSVIDTARLIWNLTRANKAAPADQAVPCVVDPIEQVLSAVRELLKGTHYVRGMKDGDPHKGPGNRLADAMALLDER